MMENQTLSDALEREHHQIDEGIAAFTSASGEHGHEHGYDTAPLTRAMEGLRRHIYLEEEFLFPPLRAAGMVAPIFVMLREHGQLWKTLDTLQAQLGEEPDESMLGACRDLVAQLEAHNMKEESIVYPQADVVLESTVSAELMAFLDSGVMPEGWVCQGAAA